ncbi:MAG: hypothetical protein J1E63_04430 [Muribaculaceae bacterium]|nr:hypothetical protein [Muribaculaceae bacterium]
MYFDSYMKDDGGLSWLLSSNERIARHNAYFTELERLAENIDDIEVQTSFQTDLTPEDFDSGYEYIFERLRELRHFVVYEDKGDNYDELIDGIYEIYDELSDLRDDAQDYDNYNEFDDGYDDDFDDDDDDFVSYDLDDFDDSDW